MKFSFTATVFALGLFSAQARFTGEARRLAKGASATKSAKSCELPGDVNVAGCFFGNDDPTPPSSNGDHELEDLLCSGECAYHNYSPGLEFLCLGGTNEYMLISDLNHEGLPCGDGPCDDGDGATDSPVDIIDDIDGMIYASGPSYCCPNTCGSDVLNRANCKGPFYYYPPSPFYYHMDGRRERRLGDEDADGGGEPEARKLRDGHIYPYGVCNMYLPPPPSGNGYYDVAVGLSGYTVSVYCCEASEDGLPSLNKLKPKPYNVN